MTTYFCKCGKTFQKNTEAGTTGFRMPDYGPGHECFGCPFVCEVATWDPTRQENAVENHECRGSKSIRYGTTAGINADDKCTANIFTLDFDFLKHVHEFAETLEGFEPDRYFFDHRSASYGADGRYRCTLYPKQNKTGIAAKAALQERFFYPDGSRKDVTPEREKEIILNQIKEAKAMAHGKSAPAEVGTVYYNHNVVYSADQRENSEKFTVFKDDADHPCPSMRTEVAAIPDFDTFTEAQNALDELAIKRGFTKERSAGTETPEMKQPDDLGPDGMEELAEYQELTHAGTVSANDPQKSEADDADSADDADETPDTVADDGDSAKAGTEAPPCDWKNASGEDDGEEDDLPPNDIPAGEPVSLRDAAFSDLLDICDSKINQALRTMFELKQNSFTFNAKITFENRGGAFGIKHETGFNFDPIKVKDKGELYEEIPIRLNDNGDPIIPYDREHQLSFDETQPGQREVSPSGTATVDGNTGIVEGYQEDKQESSDPPENSGADDFGRVPDDDFPPFEDESAMP